MEVMVSEPWSLSFVMKEKVLPSTVSRVSAVIKWLNIKSVFFTYAQLVKVSTK